jgi:hypothetical protein
LLHFTTKNKFMSRKLFVFVATDAPVAVVIRKGKFNGRPCYEMIQWNLATNEFTEGQWLMNKQLFVRGCAISPNGQWFGWVYNKYWQLDPRERDTFAGVSRVPNFTADLFATKTCGRWFSVQFDCCSRPLAGTFAFEQRGPRRVEVVAAEGTDAVPSGLQPETFVWNGQTISVRGYELLVDGHVVYDATDHVFVNRPPTDAEETPALRRSTRARRPTIRYGYA